jgi:hypothetical protein
VIWRRLADWALEEVDWSHVGHMSWVMTIPVHDDGRSLIVQVGYVTMSTQLWRSTNGGWLHARRWPSLWEMMPRMTFDLDLVFGQ